MENRIINIEILAEVAEALKDIKDDMVFVGGAVVSLYADETAADEMRPTEDIDMYPFPILFYEKRTPTFP